MATTEGRPVKAVTNPQAAAGEDRLIEITPPHEAPTELVFESTKEFEDDVKRLAAIDQSLVADMIDRQFQLLLSDRLTFDGQLSRPFVPRLAHGLDSSLYVLSIGDDQRVILTVDDDPIFGRIVVTLFRLVGRSDVDQSYKATASVLYRGF